MSSPWSIVLLLLYRGANLVRFSPMFEDVGIAASSGVISALMVGVSVIPVILIQWKGQAWRQKRGE